MPEFQLIIARKIFFQNFRGHVPPCPHPSFLRLWRRRSVIILRLGSMQSVRSGTSPSRSWRVLRVRYLPWSHRYPDTCAPARPGPATRCAYPQKDDWGFQRLCARFSNIQKPWQSNTASLSTVNHHHHHHLFTLSAKETGLIFQTVEDTAKVLLNAYIK